METSLRREPSPAVEPFVCPERGLLPRSHTVVWLDGEHDSFTAPALAAKLSLAAGGDGADLIVDLGGVTFMDAATIRVLFGTAELLASRSRSLRLRRPSRSVSRVLEVCGLSERIDRSG